MGGAHQLCLQVLKVGDHTYDMVCASIDPHSQGETYEEVKALYQNTNLMYNALSQRHAQSHSSLNNINKQLPKIGNAVGNLRGDKADATLSKIIHAVEESKEKILAEVKNIRSTSNGRKLLSDGTDFLEPESQTLGEKDLANMKMELKSEMKRVVEEEMHKELAEVRMELAKMTEMMKALLVAAEK